MFNNFSISLLSVKLLLISPLILQTHLYEKAQFNSFFRINCIKSCFSFLYSRSHGNIYFKHSIFSRFNGQCPIFINTQDYNFLKLTKKYKFYQKIKNEEEKNYYEGDEITQPQLFYTNPDTSVTFKQCSFIDCVNENSQGGAISFRRSYASLIIQDCIFLRCKSYLSSGAIYVLQLLDGNWLIGDVSISNTEFEECNDCNGDNDHDYIAGVIECSIGKGDYNYCFSMKNSKMINCEFDKKNRITEAQIRLSTNTFRIDFFNITNSDQKVDLSAIFFNKFVQEPSRITFMNGINQYGFSFFEIYDLESSYINIENINMINTTFVNYDKDMLLTKVAFFNIYFARDNSLFIQNFIIIDFTTVITDDEGNNDYALIEPVIIQIPETSKDPITRKIYSNQKFCQTNLVNYTLIPTMKYDFTNHIIVGFSEPEQSITDELLIPTEITAVKTNEFNFVIENINENSNKKKIYFDTFLVTFIVLAIVIINVFSIVIFTLNRKKVPNSGFISDNENDDENESQDEVNQTKDESVHDLSVSNTNYELFFNPKCKSQAINLQKSNFDFISMILEKGDIFKSDFEEI